MRAVSPTGVNIEGTLETLRAVALASDWRQGLFEVEFEYVGQTDIFWDTQESLVNPLTGQTIFVDAEGGEWTKDQITLIDD